MAFESNSFCKSLFQEWEDPCLFSSLKCRRGSDFSNHDLIRLSNNFQKVEFELNFEDKFSDDPTRGGKLIDDSLTRIQTIEDLLESDSYFKQPSKKSFQVPDEFWNTQTMITKQAND